MSNAITTTPSFDVANIDALVNSLESATADLTSGGVQYIKYKKGEWVIGRGEDTFPDNSFEAIPDLPNLQMGWVCWKDGQLVDEQWYGLDQQMPDKDMLTDHGPYTQGNDGWSKNVKFQMQILPTKGVESAILAQFTGSSNGAQKATGEMIKSWISAVRTGQHQGEVPVFEFASDSYKHKQYGKVSIPAMKLVRWHTPDETPAIPVEDVKPKGSSASKGIPLE